MLNKHDNVSASIIGRLMVTSRVIEQVADAILARFGITLAMYELMMLMSDGIDTTTKMASISRITLASITHKTKLMEERGYIRRVVNQKDKRVWCFSLTPSGQSLLAAVSAVYDKVTRPLYSQVSERDKQRVLSFLTATEDHLRYALDNRSMMLEHIEQFLAQGDHGPDTGTKERKAE